MSIKIEDFKGEIVGAGRGRAPSEDTLTLQTAIRESAAGKTNKVWPGGAKDKNYKTNAVKLRNIARKMEPSHSVHTGMVGDDLTFSASVVGVPGTPEKAAEAIPGTLSGGRNDGPAKPRAPRKAAQTAKK